MNFDVVFLMLFVFLGISWSVRVMVSKDAMRRVDRRLAEEAACLLARSEEI